MISAADVRILVVDDHGIMRDLLRRTLEHLGFRTFHQATNPVDALPLARSERVHVIISDYNMPQMNGLEFLKMVRRDPILAKVGFVMLSGSADAEIVRAAHEAGVSCYIPKPFSLNHLKDSLEAMFGGLVGSRVELKVTV